MIDRYRKLIQCEFYELINTLQPITPITQTTNNASSLRDEKLFSIWIVCSQTLAPTHTNTSSWTFYCVYTLFSIGWHFDLKRIQIIHGIWKMCRDRLLNFELFVAYQEFMNVQSVFCAVLYALCIFCLVSEALSHTHAETYSSVSFLFLHFIVAFDSLCEWNEWRIVCNKIDVRWIPRVRKVFELRYLYETNKIA